ncbi:MAG: OsmC family protein [Gemmatimonadota bacterium]
MDQQFAVSIAQWENFQFLIDFNQDGVADLLTDETEPTGSGRGPDPTRLLAAAIGNCLASSLLFCLKKAHIDVSGMKCVVEGDLERAARGHWRVRQIRARIQPSLKPEDAQRLGQCASLFEEFCIVTGSVRTGIDVVVDVAPQTTGAGDVILT